MSISFTGSLGRVAFGSTLMAANSSHSFAEIALQFGVPKESPDIMRALRQNIGSLIDQTQVMSRLSDEDRELLRDFVVDGELMLDEVELERALNETLKITRALDSGPDIIEDEARGLLAIGTAEIRPQGTDPSLTLHSIQNAPAENIPTGLVATPLSELLVSDRVTLHRDGRIEVMIRSDVSLQGLYDSYRLLRYQTPQLQQSIIILQESDADIKSLSECMDELAEALDNAYVTIVRERSALARVWLEIGDDWIDKFFKRILQVAVDIGLEIDPHTGQIKDFDVSFAASTSAQLGVDPAAPEQVVDHVQTGPVISEAPSADIPMMYLVTIGETSQMMDFYQHDRIGIYEDESGGLCLLYKEESPDQKCYGVFYRSAAGLVFESLKADTTAMSDDHSMTIHVSAQPVGIRTLRTPIVSYLREQLATQQLEISPMLNDLLIELERQEANDVAVEMRIRDFNWIMMRPRTVSFDDIVDQFSPNEVVPLMSGIVKFLSQGEELYRNRATQLLKALLDQLDNKQQARFISDIVQAYLEPPPEVELDESNAEQARLEWFKSQLVHLNALADSFEPKARMKVLRETANIIFRSDSIEQAELDFLARLAKGLPEEVARDEIKKLKSRELKRFLFAYFKGLPMVASIYAHYRKSQHPTAFVKQAIKRVRDFLYGGRIFTNTPELHLSFAYAGLDLSYQQFIDDINWDINWQDLPVPFLRKQFIVRVPRHQATTSQIDEQVLSQAQQAIARFHSPELMVDYLENVFKYPASYGLKLLEQPLHQILVRYAGDDQDREDYRGVITAGNVLTISQDLLKRMIAGKDQLHEESQDLVQNLVFALATASEAGAHLIPTIATYHEGMTPEDSVQVLSALREFYEFTIPTIMQALPIELHLPFIGEMLEQLNAQTNKVKQQSEEMIEVRFVPSKSQTDAYAGYAAEDQEKKKWLQEISLPDAQVYRMIVEEEVEEELAGVCYLKQAELDGKIVLILGIWPLAHFRMAQQPLLQQVVKEFSEIAGADDYDYVLIPTNRAQRSNRPGMNDAIDALFDDERTFKDAVEGDVFSGNSFLVVWERPPDLPKRPAPEKRGMTRESVVSLLADEARKAGDADPSDGKGGK